MSSADPQPAQPSSSKTPSPRPSRNPTRKLNPAVRRSSLLLAPTVAAPSAAAATIEHSYVFPSDNNANSNGISPGTSPLTTPSELPQLAPAEPTIYEAGNVASAAEMALRERKDSEASLKRASLFQTLSSNGMRRSRTMSIDSASDSGSESRVPALASLLETKQKDDASRTPTPPTATATAGATVSRAIPVRKLTKDKSDGYSSGVGSDSEGGSDSGLAPKKSAAAKRFGILRGAFGFGMKKRQASDASSTGVPELSVPAVAAPTEATPVPVAAEPIDIPRPAPIAVEAVPPVGDAGEVQLMSPVMEEFVPPPIPQALKPEENTVTLSPAHDALDLSSPPASPAVTMNTRSARPPVYTQPTSISIPPENEESTESAIVNDSEASVEEPTSAAKANMNGDHLEPLKDDDGASIISRMTPVSSNADLEHDHGNDPGYLTRKYASPPEGQTPRVREEDDGHHSEWEDEAIATSRLNNRASFITEEGTLASDEGSDVHQTRPNRAGLSFIAALAEKTKRQVLDEGQEEGDADSMQNHRGDEAEEDQRVPSTPFIMGFPTTTPAIMTTQGRNMTNEPIQELITPPITPESSKFPETAVPKVVEEHNEASPILPASTDAQPGSSSSPLTMATQYANHDNPHQSPWNEEKGKAPAVEHLGRPGRPAYHQQASYIEEPPSTTDSRRSSSSGEIHPTTEVTKAIPVPTISPLPTSSTIRPASPPVRSTSPTLPHAISFSLPAASPCRHSQILSASSGASGSSKPGSSTTSIPMQPMHSRDDGTMDNQPQQYPQYLSAASSSESSSPSYDISQPRRTTPNGRSSSRNAMSIWDVLLLPVTVPLAIPRFFADISFRAFVFGLACGVTLVRVGTAALSAVVLGRRDVRRPRWR